MLKPLVKVLLVNEDREILTIRRSLSDKARAGEWDFPGGNLDPGEDFVSAAIRETKEETGISIHDVKPVYSISGPGVVPGMALNWFHYVSFVTGRPKVTLSHEHTEYRWMTPRALRAGSDLYVHQQLLDFIAAHDLLRPEAITFVTVRAVIVNNKGELLILRRSQTDPFHAGEWDLPGGRVDADETIGQAVVRETKEEAGLDLQSPKLVYGASAPRRDGTGTWLFFVERTSSTPAVTLSYEHDDYKWIPFGDLPQYIDYEIILGMHGFVAEHTLLDV